MAASTWRPPPSAARLAPTLSWRAPRSSRPPTKRRLPPASPSCEVMSALEHRHGHYLISDDPVRLEVTAIHAYLTRSYWSENVPPETVRRALHGSLCIGAYTE